jgi:hypothetical protein
MDAAPTLPLTMPIPTDESSKSKGFLKSLFGKGAETSRNRRSTGSSP